MLPKSTEPRSARGRASHTAPATSRRGRGSGDASRRQGSVVPFPASLLSFLPCLIPLSTGGSRWHPKSSTSLYRGGKEWGRASGDGRASSPGKQKAEQPKTSRPGGMCRGKRAERGWGGGGAFNAGPPPPSENTAAARQQGSSAVGRLAGPRRLSEPWGPRVAFFVSSPLRAPTARCCWRGAEVRQVGRQSMPSGAGGRPVLLCRSVLVAGAAAHLINGEALGPFDGKRKRTAPHCAPRVGGRAGAGRRQAPPPAGAPGWVLRGGRRLAGSSLRAPGPARGPRWLAW